MAKKGKAPTPVVNRRALSRNEREERMQRRLYFGAGVVIALILGVIGFGLLQTLVIAPSSPVATVNGVPIRTDTYQRWVQYRRYILYANLNQIDLQLSQLDPNDETQQFLISYMQQQRDLTRGEIASLSSSAPLEDLIDDELVRQEAARRNLTVTPDEVQREIEQGFGYNPQLAEPEATPSAAPSPTSSPEPTPEEGTPEPTSTPAPTPTPMSEEHFAQLYAAHIQSLQENAGIGEADFREMVRMSILHRKLREAMGAEVPTTAEQVRVRHILLGNEEDAKAALERIRAGEDFATVASEVSTDSYSKEQGGDLGWLPRGSRYTEAFDNAAFALEPGQVSDVVQTASGYHIIKVEEREADRPLEEDILAQMRSMALSKWLEEQRANDQVVKRFWSSDKVPKDRSRMSAAG
jgi:parvulin-like peptidyl-prolyl isomerase